MNKKGSFGVVMFVIILLIVLTSVIDYTFFNYAIIDFIGGLFN